MEVTYKLLSFVEVPNMCNEQKHVKLSKDVVSCKDIFWSKWEVNGERTAMEI